MLVIPAAGPSGTPRTDDHPLRALAVGTQLLALMALERLLSASPLRALVTLSLESDEALELASSGDIDVVICDLDASPISGPKLAASLIAAGGAPPVMLLADVQDAGRLIGTLRCGARGFLTKDSTVDEFIAAVVGLRDGRLVVAERLLDAIIDRVAWVPQRTHSDITARRVDVADAGARVGVGARGVQARDFRPA